MLTPKYQDHEVVVAEGTNRKGQKTQYVSVDINGSNIRGGISQADWLLIAALLDSPKAKQAADHIRQASDQVTLFKAKSDALTGRKVIWTPKS